MCILVLVIGIVFWATVCKTVRRMLWFAVCCRTVVLSFLSVCDVGVCGQTVAWIKMKLGTKVGLGPGHIVLDRTQLPPQKKK